MAEIRMEHLRNTRSLVEGLKSEAAWHEAHLASLLGAAKALGENGDAILSEIARLNSIIAGFEARVAEADRRTSRVIEAAKVYIATVNGGDAHAAPSARKHLLETFATQGAPSARATSSQAIGFLATLARSESWREIMTLEGSMARSSTLWIPPSQGGYHPRDVARMALREISGVDPDGPDAKNAYWTVDTAGVEEEDHEE